MSIPTNLLTLIAVTGLLLVIVIILVVIFARSSGRSRNSQKAESKKGSVKTHPRMQEILRLWRDPDTGRVITEFQNRAIRDPRTLSVSERDYLLRLAKDWSAWLGIPESKPTEKVEASPVVPASPEALTGPTDPSNLAAPADLAAEPAPVVVAAAAAGVQENLPVAPLAKVSPAIMPLPAPPTPLSIVQQVDEILQEILASRPTPGPTIKLVEDQKDGVIVWVNTNKYVGIESVTDPEVRAIIRLAAVEWERRTEK
jgi:hypothetical protein